LSSPLFREFAVLGKNDLHCRENHARMMRGRISNPQVKSVGRWTLRVVGYARLRRIRERPMLVRDVLESKGRRIVTIDSEATVSEAIAKLVQNNIGSLPVLDHEGHLIGIFSERDVLRIIHHRGEGFGRLLVYDVMTRDPVTCNLDDDVNDVMG